MSDIAAINNAPIIGLVRDEVWGSNDGKTWIPVYRDTATKYKMLKVVADHGSFPNIKTYTIAIPDWVRSSKGQP